MEREREKGEKAGKQTGEERGESNSRVAGEREGKHSLNFKEGAMSTDAF